MAIGDIFSKRDRVLPDVFQTDSIPQELRVQVGWIWRKTIAKLPPAIRSEVATGIHEVICTERGVLCLHARNLGAEEDLASAIVAGDTLAFLDVIEMTFRVIATWQEDFYFGCTRSEAIDELNHRFRENAVGYEFDAASGCIIPVTSLVTHEEAVRPALRVLTHPAFVEANREYIEAFDDFKKGDYDDCLAKCCSSFESTMKVICSRKAWAYNQNDTAAPLLRTIISNAGMPPFFEQPLLLIATLRNRLSSSHGRGITPAHVPEHFAKYALNATASAILFLVEATGV